LPAIPHTINHRCTGAAEPIESGSATILFPGNPFDDAKAGGKMAKYRCTICGYIYDPAAGDPTQGVAPGTAFEALPEGWTCPVCGALKTDFIREE
jgi:rubredoxin